MCAVLQHSLSHVHVASTSLSPAQPHYMAARAYDLVVFGATGFTGRLCAQYLAANAPKGFKWALAGRQADKLRDMAASLSAASKAGQTVGVIVADTSSVEAVTKATRVVLSTVGPFIVHGENLVRSCVEQGTDYIDSTGEVSWVKVMVDRYGEAAAKKGVLLVSMCGFDSIPADLGTLLCVDHARSAGVRVSSVTGYVAMKGSASGGTLASFLANFEHKLPGANIMDPLMLVPRRPGGPLPSTLAQPTRPSPIPFWTSDMHKYAYLFEMSVVNQSVVRKSAALAALGGADGAGDGKSSQAYSLAPFLYTEYRVTTSLFRAVISTTLFVIFMLIGQFALGRSLLRRVLPRPGEGPSDAARAASFFNYTLVGKTEEATPRKIVATVAGGDPGYTETAKMLCESAMCVALQRDKLPAKTFGYGFLTPATALGMLLVERLRKAGMRLEIVTSPFAPSSSAPASAAKL